MDESRLNQVLLEVYIDTIKQQIEDKKFFIKQARNAIESLKTSEDTEARLHFPTSEEWQNFLSRPMFFPERSDPIGLSLAFTSLGNRRQSSETWLNEMTMQLDDIKSMIEEQRRVNHDMAVLLELLQHKMDIPPINENRVHETPLQRNRRIQKDMEDFVKDFLSFDLASSSPDSAGQVYKDVMLVIGRLITYDTNLKATDFPDSTKGLLRLLLRGNLVTITGNGDERYVKLINFANSEIT